MLALCVVSGIPLAFANATPGTVAAQLPAPMVVAWGVMLAGGSALTLYGALRQTATGVIAEQVGSVSLGFACLIYAAAIWSKAHWAGSVPMFLIGAFGAASIVRYFQLRAYLRAVETITRAMRDESEES